MRSLEALLSHKRIRHLERSRDRARRRVRRLQRFIVGSADIVSLRDSMATSLFKKIEEEMGKALFEVIKNDSIKAQSLQNACGDLQNLFNGKFMFAMTKLCRRLPALFGEKKRNVFALIKEVKNDVLSKRYGEVTVRTQHLAVAFQAFHFLREARNESAHLFERMMKKSRLPNRRHTQWVFLKDLKRALKKRDVSDRLQDMVPLLKMEVDLRLSSM